MILDVALEAVLLSQQEWLETSQIVSTIAYSMAIFFGKVFESRSALKNNVVETPMTD